MTWTVVGLFGTFGLGALGLLTWVITHLETKIGLVEINLGHRITEQGAAFDRFERLVDLRFSEVYRRFDGMDRHLDQVDGRLERVEGRLERVEDRLERVEGRLERVEDRLEGAEGRLESLDQGVRGLRSDLTNHVAHHSA